jgi:hypothetical protein
MSSPACPLDPGLVRGVTDGVIISDDTPKIQFRSLTA